MHRRIKQRSGKRLRREGARRSLRFQSLESRRLLAADAALVDITGIWITVGDREYFTSEQASVTIDMFAGEELRVSGIRYGLDEAFAPSDGVVAFESYVRREHGASSIGSYDYTDGRFADPIDVEQVAGQFYSHDGNDSGWQLDVIDNRVAVVAVRYFENESSVEDRMFIDVNVRHENRADAWTESINPIHGDWQTEDEAISGDSSDVTAEDFDPSDITGLTVVETGHASDRYEVGVKAMTVEESAYANGFVVVDYRSENDFVYAGLRSIADKWVIGHFDGSFNDLASLNQDIQPRQSYDLRVAVDGSHVALAADGVLRVSHDFDRPLNEGAIGLANQYAYTHFTGFHFFDNSSSTETLPSLPELEQAYTESSLVVERAQQAATTAAATADEADQTRRDAEARATELESIKRQVEAAAEEATAVQFDAEQELRSTELIIEQTPTLIEAAEEDFDAASVLLKEAHEAQSNAEDDVREAQRDTDKSDEKVNQRDEEYREAEQELANAVETSQAAAAGATAARESSDEAARIAEEAQSAPKSIRKAAEKAARDADKVADNAEREARDAAEAVEQIAGDVAKAFARLQDARDDAERNHDTLREASERLEASTEDVNQAVSQRADASERIDRAVADREAAAGKLDELQAHVDSATETAQATALRSQKAQHEANLARESAQLAAETSAAANLEARRLRESLEAAQQELLAAETALQDELARQAAEEANADEDFRVYSLNFNEQHDGAFETVQGHSELVAGQLHLGPDEHPLAISVIDETELPPRTATRMYATVRADDLPGHYNNAFIVFDYQSPDDFKYAGAWAGADRWAVGEVVDGQLVDVAAVDEVIGEGPAYELQVWIQDATLTLLVEGQQKVQHTFDSAIDDGQLGIANYYSQSRFDQVAVMQLYGGAGDVGIEQEAANDAAISDLF